jgi:hypothetical protein
MRSTTTTRYVSITNSRKGMASALVSSAGFATTPGPASAMVIAPVSSLQAQLKQQNLIVEVDVRRGDAVRRTTAVGARGNVASRTQGYRDLSP